MRPRRHVWPTAEVVAAANAALYEALEARNADASLLGETMKRLRRAAGVADVVHGGPHECHSELLGGEPGTAEELFQLWLDARQRASEDLLFPDAATSLAEVRRRHPDAMVGAVTNGRGDPRRIPSLAPYFDFCVSGEDADVHPQRKPAPRIYEAALERAHCGPDGWVHLGDDVLNDCSAAKSCGARTVWRRGGAVRGRRTRARRCPPRTARSGGSPRRPSTWRSPWTARLGGLRSCRTPLTGRLIMSQVTRPLGARREAGDLARVADPAITFQLAPLASNATTSASPPSRTMFISRCRNLWVASPLVPGP